MDFPTEWDIVMRIRDEHRGWYDAFVQDWLRHLTGGSPSDNAFLRWLNTAYPSAVEQVRSQLLSEFAQAKQLLPRFSLQEATVLVSAIKPDDLDGPMSLRDAYRLLGKKVIDFLRQHPEMDNDFMKHLSEKEKLFNRFPLAEGWLSLVVLHAVKLYYQQRGGSLEQKLRNIGLI